MIQLIMCTDGRSLAYHTASLARYEGNENW